MNNYKFSEKINRINKEFYNKYSKSFSNSRNSNWIGFKKIFENIDNNNIKKVLDLACGNGRFYLELIKHINNSEYIGVDNNVYLLNEAKDKIEKNILSNKYELIEEDLFSNYSINTKDFDLIVMFGFMHHIPSLDIRIKIFNRIKQQLNKNGIFVFSTWNFLGKSYEKRNDKKKIIKEINIDEKELNKSDYFLNWKDINNKDDIYRYAYYYSKGEILELIDIVGFQLIIDYESDGRDNISNHYYIVKIK